MSKFNVVFKSLAFGSYAYPQKVSFIPRKGDLIHGKFVNEDSYDYRVEEVAVLCDYEYDAYVLVRVNDKKITTYIDEIS